MMDAANTSNAATDQIMVTWASTPERERLGKIWAPEGKEWEVTGGVKRLAYVFEQPSYPDLEAFAADLDTRLRAGAYALVAGRLKRLPETLDRDKAYRRLAKNFADLKCWLLTLDVDGLAPTKAGERLDRPEDFGKRALAEFRKRLPAALAAADCLLVATSSTGLPFNAKGEPANGCARFRAIFLLSRPLFFAEQKQLTLALKELPGLECLGEEICTLPQFCFIARPKFRDGVADPISAPVLLFKGDQRQVDVDALETQIDVTIAVMPKQRGRPNKADRLLDVDPNIQHALIEQLVATIPNDTVEHGGDWTAVLHGIKGASGDPDWGKTIWLAFCARWTKGNAKQAEDERVWDTARFDHGHAGIRKLLQLAWRAGTPEAIAAVEAVKLAQAQWAFRSPPDDLPDEDLEPTPARDPWARLRAALNWSGADRARNSGSGIAWLEPGIAMFGSRSQEGMAQDRAWVTDRHARGYIAITNGLPSDGKTFLSVTYANTIVTERPTLAGLDRIERPGAVVIIAADSEGAEEFQRKDVAFRDYHGLTNADFKHAIFIFDAPGPFVEKRKNETWGPSKWIIAQAPKLAKMREDNRLALIVVDTLLGVSGGGNTSDTADMQAIVDVAKMLATVLDCAVEIINYLTKGGAKSDPTSMDAGLGARPVTATARFVANLTKANGVVTVTMAKQSYMGGPRGTRYFEFKSVDVPVAIHDVDGAYVGTEPRPLGVLIPAQIAALERMAEGDALRALWEAHQKGVKIKRGSIKGPQSTDHASLIVQTALDLGLNPRGRKKAEALLEKLLQDARVKVVPAWDGAHNRFEQLVPDDPSDEP